MYDVIIVGAGPAGLTAALYAQRNGKSALVIEKGTIGGQITSSPKVENIPGFASLSGNEFALAFVNMSEAEALLHCELVDLGLPVSSGLALDLRDAFTGESVGKKADYFNPTVPGHDMKLYIGKMVPAHA